MAEVFAMCGAIYFFFLQIGLGAPWATPGGRGEGGRGKASIISKSVISGATIRAYTVYVAIRLEI